MLHRCFVWILLRNSNTFISDVFRFRYGMYCHKTCPLRWYFACKYLAVQWELKAGYSDF